MVPSPHRNFHQFFRTGISSRVAVSPPVVLRDLSGTKGRCGLLLCIWGEKEKWFKVTFNQERSFIEFKHLCR